MHPHTYDLVVVGGGILGLAHAYHALQKGLRVALIERDPKPNGASVRNFGQIVPSGFGQTWQRYGRKSLEVYKSIQRQHDITLRNEGTIYIASNDEELTLLHELAQINKQNDYPSILLDKKACISRHPSLKSSYVRGGLLFPEECVIDPHIGIHGILQYCVDHLSLNYFAGHTICDITTRHDDILISATSGKSIIGKKVIVCSGAEFNLLFPQKFRHSGIQLVKIQMMETMPQSKRELAGSILTGKSIRRYESFQECPSYRSIKSKEDPLSYTNINGVHILFKQLLDGAVVVGDSHHYVNIDESTQFDFKIDNQLNCFMLSKAQHIFDLETWGIRNTWTGIYSQCSDKPIFDQEIEENVHAITAIGGKGMTASFGYAAEKINQLFNV